MAFSTFLVVLLASVLGDVGGVEINGGSGIGAGIGSTLSPGNASVKASVVVVVNAEVSYAVVGPFGADDLSVVVVETDAGSVVDSLT